MPHPPGFSNNAEGAWRISRVNGGFRIIVPELGKANAYGDDTVAENL
jgi:hypothetical protein